MCYGVFYTYYWFAPDQNDQNALDIYFMVNGNIYNNQLPQEYMNDLNAYALEPLPPSTYLATSYENAYQTAFEAEENVALNNYYQTGGILFNSLRKGFINGTFGYTEQYENLPYISYLTEDADNYQSQPYLFVSTGSGGGNGYMYLNWMIATFGIPYELVIP
ncbi:hypothetical protein [Vulcanisaeta distributa]|uniref:hypothetical protein n=1 Tax=Vulcanisaeta distributa TaxID=164451 RepID=UPI000A5B9941|nr:hypothetical protein [Vulcanisaeta distributa]